MASSVSSKCAFSSLGIIITKHHNRLKGDIVEALQAIKCVPQAELLVCEPDPTLTLEFDIIQENEGALQQPPRLSLSLN
jgi:hypothetical protein